MSQHDETKRMLGLIRESNTKKTDTTKKMLREQVESATENKLNYLKKRKNLEILLHPEQALILLNYTLNHKM